MANPQTENGFTKISNELMNAFCSFRIPGEVMQVVFVVIRKTYGYQKKDDYISYSQFTELTGMDRSNVKRALKKAVELNVIIKDGSKYINKYKFNKDYSKWGVGSEVTPKSDQSGVKEVKKVGSEVTHTKDNIQKKETQASPDTLPNNKKDMIKYNEKRASDTYEDVIDADSGELVKDEPKGRRGKTINDLIGWAVKRRGFPFVYLTKQRTAISKMADAGIEPIEIAKRWEELESNTKLYPNGIDFTNVANSFDKKR